MKNNNNENTQGNMNQNIEELYNYHFEVKETKESIFSTSVIRMKGLFPGCSEEQSALGNHFKMIRKKYSRQMEFSTTDDFINEYSFLMIEAMQELMILEPLEVLLANPHIYAARLAFIKEHIAHGFVMVANPNKYVVNTSNGRRFIEIPMDSIDKEIGDGSFTTKDFLTEDSNIFHQGETNHNHFTQWVIDNKDTVLTAKQNKVFTKLMDIYSPLTDRSQDTLDRRNDMLAEIDMTNQEINQMFKVIKKRAYKKYTEVYKGMQSRTSESNKKFRKLLTNYIDQANYVGWKTQEDRQETLTNIIANQYDKSEEFEILITKGLKLDDKIEIVRGVKGKQLISNRVLRLVRQNAEEYLASVEHVHITPSDIKFDYKENLFTGLADLPTKGGRLTPQGTIEYKNADGDWVTFKK